MDFITSGMTDEALFVAVASTDQRSGFARLDNWRRQGMVVSIATHSTTHFRREFTRKCLLQIREYPATSQEECTLLDEDHSNSIVTSLVPRNHQS